MSAAPVFQPRRVLRLRGVAWRVMGDVGKIRRRRTGTREAPLKRDGVVQYFSEEQARAKAAELMARPRPYSLADFRYWAAKGEN